MADTLRERLQSYLLTVHLAEDAIEMVPLSAPDLQALLNAMDQQREDEYPVFWHCWEGMHDRCEHPDVCGCECHDTPEQQHEKFGNSGESMPSTLGTKP